LSSFYYIIGDKSILSESSANVIILDLSKSNYSIDGIVGI